MTEKQYVVTGHMVSLDTTTAQGRMRMSFVRGNLVPPDVPDEQIRHHLDVNLIAEVPSASPAGVDSAGAVVVDDERVGAAGEPGTEFPAANVNDSRTSDDKAKADADKRAAAKAKLPEDGSAPDGRASKDVLVEYLAGKGYDYNELVKQDKGELLELAKQQQ